MTTHLGIVGNGADKFTPLGVQRAQDWISKGLQRMSDVVVVSGRSPMGGVDVWAESIARLLGKATDIYPPKTLDWAGYRVRNLQIASHSDRIVVVVADRLPPGYVGMKFDYCYHCLKMGRDSMNHIKSGACWTAMQALRLGRRTQWHIVSNY